MSQRLPVVGVLVVSVMLLVLVAHTLKSLRNARIDRIGTTDFSVRRTLIGEKDAAAFEDRARLN